MNNWLIVGLGNPGASYERTRHNLGFMVVDELAQICGTQIRRAECRSQIGRGNIENRTVELVKPQTYMNLSGEAVSCLLAKDDHAFEKMIVISDDLALPLGTIRIRPKGTHGGHNGLRSIIDRVGRNDFIRLRLGIMPEHPVSNTKDFVLQNFSKADDLIVKEIVKSGAEAVQDILRDGVDKAMAKWN